MTAAEDERKQEEAVTTAAPAPASAPAESPKDEDNLGWDFAFHKSYAEEHGLETSHIDTSPADKQAAEERSRHELAQRIWEDGNALAYICSSCQDMHLGDEAAIKSMIISFACTRISNLKQGIHISISGNQGSGKSHIGDTVKKHLPAGVVQDSSVSDKALFYHPLPDKTMFILDDQALSEEAQELIKNATTKWQERASRLTVHNQNPEKLTAPARSPFVIIKKEMNGDEQVLDRQMCFWTDESMEHKQAVISMILAMAAHPEKRNSAEESAEISRRIWQFLPDENIVWIPYAQKIRMWDDTKTHPHPAPPRALNILLSLIAGIALLRNHSAEEEEEIEIVGNDGKLTKQKAPVINATEADFYEAANIMNPLMMNKGGSQLMKLSRTSVKVLDYLKEKYPSNDAGGNPIYVPFTEIREKCGISQSDLSHALYGQDNAKTNGILRTVSAIEVVDESKAYSSGTTRRGKAIQWNPEAYIQWDALEGGFILRDEEE